MRIYGNAYQLTFEVDGERIVTTASCSCLAGGDGWCKHSCALFTWINEESTKTQTDRQQTWSDPSTRAKLLYKDPRSAVELFGGRRVVNNFKPTPEKIQFQKDLMEKCGLLVGFDKILLTIAAL